MQPMVPVVSATGKPLMPTTHRRANKLIAKGRALRRFDPPVIARIQDGRLLLDPRTLADEEIEAVAAAVRGALAR